MSETYTTLLALIGAGFGLGIGAYFGITVASFINELLHHISRAAVNVILKLRGKRHAD